MRRKDREIKDFNSILEIINRCDTIRLGLSDGDYPYIVPLSFGTQTDGEKIYFYIHGALEGRKVDLFKKNKVCSFEMDCDHKIDIDVKKRRATMKYSSVMGKADIEILPPKEKQQAAKVFLSGYKETENFDYNTKALSSTMMAKLTVTEISAKSNIK